MANTSPFLFLQKALLGRRKLSEILGEADKLYSDNYIKLTDTKATTLDGGASVAGTQTRILNTEDTDTGNHCTLTSNQFTLAAGTYQIDASVIAFNTDRHKGFLYNITDAGNEVIGTSENANSTNAVANRSFIKGEFVISASKVFEIRHYTQTVRATDGLGASSNDGTSEIYTIAELWKIK